MQLRRSLRVFVYHTSDAYDQSRLRVMRDHISQTSACIQREHLVAYNTEHFAVPDFRLLKYKNVLST